MYRTWEIVSQHQMSIVQDGRQQDEIASARLDRKSTEALWEDGGEKEEGSPMYLRIVGRKKDRNSIALGSSTVFYSSLYRENWSLWSTHVHLHKSNE